MGDDWKTKICLECGHSRPKIGHYLVCTNDKCRDYGRGGPDKVERTINAMKYVLVKKYDDESEGVFIVDDPVSAYRSGKYQEENGDKIFQLGNEVKLKVTIEPTEVYRVKVHPSDIAGFGLKGDLGLGKYRG